MIINPVVARTLRDNMRIIGTQTAEGLLSRLWWRDVAFESNSESGTEILVFALEQARLRDAGETGGRLHFDDRHYLTTKCTHRKFRDAFELTEDEASDLDSNKISAAAEWQAEIVRDALLHPQRQLARSIIQNVETYDGRPIFAANHPLNGDKNNPSTDVFTNDLTGMPINGALDVATTNFQRAISHVTAVPKTPAGNARNLVVRAVVGSPILYPRLCQLTAAQFGPAAGGTADFKPVLAAYGGVKPVAAPELGAAFPGGSDTTYYLVAEFSSVHAPFVYWNRTPFSTRSNFEQDAELDRIESLEWHASGRNYLMPMHPFMIFRVN